MPLCLSWIPRKGKYTYLNNIHKFIAKWADFVCVSAQDQLGTGPVITAWAVLEAHLLNNIASNMEKFSTNRYRFTEYTYSHILCMQHISRHSFAEDFIGFIIYKSLRYCPAVSPPSITMACPVI